MTVLKSVARARKTTDSYIYKMSTAFKRDSGRQNWASLHYSHLVSGTIKYQAVTDLEQIRLDYLCNYIAVQRASYRGALRGEKVSLSPRPPIHRALLI